MSHRAQRRAEGLAEVGGRESAAVAAVPHLTRLRGAPCQAALRIRLERCSSIDAKTQAQFARKREQLEHCEANAPRGAIIAVVLFISSYSKSPRASKIQLQPSSSAFSKRSFARRLILFSIFKTFPDFSNCSQLFVTCS